MSCLTVDVYLISLRNNKYFILKTKQKNFDLNYHFNSNKYEFTDLNKPLSIIKVYKNCDNFDLDKIVKENMYFYGIENVRGGSYCDLHLSDYQIQTLQHELLTSEDKCYKCGKESCNFDCSKKSVDYSVIKINQNLLNNTYKQPVKICGYVYYTGCCVCGKNSVGKGTTPSCYNNIITNPSYKQNNKINELIICCSCAKTVKGKTLLDTNSNMYKVEEIILQPNDS